MLSINTQAENIVVIEGVLQEIDLKEGVSDRNGQKRDYIAGTITIEVAQTVNGVEEVHEVPVSVYANKLKNDGNPNPAYKNIDELRKGYASLASGAGAAADKVRVSRGELQENTFSSDGRTISTFRIRNSFFNRVTADPQPTAAFKNKIVLLSIAPEILNDVETNRLKIMGALVCYGGRVDVLTYYVEDPTAIAYITKNWQEGDTVIVSGRLRFSAATVEQKAPQEEVGFGEAMQTSTTRRVRELIITSGSPGGLDEEESYDAGGEITHALAERKARIAAEASKNAPAASTPSPATRQKAKFDGGF